MSAQPPVKKEKPRLEEITREEWLLTLQKVLGARKDAYDNIHGLIATTE